jgi:hypothetical protein
MGNLCCETETGDIYKPVYVRHTRIDPGNLKSVDDADGPAYIERYFKRPGQSLSRSQGKDTQDSFRMHQVTGDLVDRAVTPPGHHEPVLSRMLFCQFAGMTRVIGIKYRRVKAFSVQMFRHQACNVQSAFLFQKGIYYEKCFYLTGMHGTYLPLKSCKRNCKYARGK